MNDEVKELPEILENTIFIPDLKAKTKQEVLSELADKLVSLNAIPADQRTSVLTALEERENKMSTGMQYGVAIPHARTDVVDSLLTLIAISKDGVDFDSLDGEITQIFVGTLSPSCDANSHIKFLAEVSRNLSNKKIREKLLKASTHEEMRKVICGEFE